MTHPTSLLSLNRAAWDAVEDALSEMKRCVHDGGFDREIGPIGCALGDKCVCIGVYPLVATAKDALHVSACPCTLIEQDEDCPEGYPSMLCGICKGTGNAPQDQVTALAVEMIKIASDIGEPDDPFAAWESVELLKSQNDQMRKALDKIADGPREVSKTYAELFAELTAEARAAIDAVSATGEA